VRILTTLGLVVAGGLGGLWASAMAREPAKPVPRASLPVLAPATDELVAPRREVASLRRDVHRPVAAPEAVAEAAERAPLAAPTRENLAAVATRLESRLHDEGRDAAWSTSTEQAIAGVFRADFAAGSRLLDASCGRNLCRVRVSHASLRDRDRLFDDLKHTPPFDTQGFVDPAGTSDAPESVIYVARQDVPLFAADEGL
jgi:hypothetical protein